MPPSLREHQEEEARLKKRQAMLQAEGTRKNEEARACESADKGKLAVAMPEHIGVVEEKQKSVKRKNKQDMEDVKKAKEQLEEEKQNEKMRDFAARQKKKELARKRAARIVAGKNTRRKKRVRDNARGNVSVRRTNLY